MRDIYKETIEKWGVLSQIGMANEEMGELIASLNQFLRGRVGPDKVAEEIADVILMMQEMAYVFGRDKVIKWYSKKKETVISRLGIENKDNNGNS